MPLGKGYKYLEHTADVEFVAYGKDMEECFKNAIMALFDTVSYVRAVKLSKPKKVTFLIKDKARTPEDLLWYTLQDAVSITDSKSLFGYDVAKLKIKEQ